MPRQYDRELTPAGWVVGDLPPSGGASELDALTDVVVTAPAVGQVIKWNGTEWVNAADATVGDGTLAALTDVTVTAPTTGQVLKWNGTEWVNDTDATGGGGGAAALGDLTDVTIDEPFIGQVLKFNGGSWVNDVEAPAGLGSVTSVALSVPTGLAVSGSPVTTTGTLAVTLAAGYVIPTQATLDGKVNAADFSPLADLVGAVELTDEFIGLRAGVPYKEPLSSLPTGSMTAAQIRDALETLTTTNRLDASAIQNLPTVSAGSPVTVTHDGAGADPVTGDTLTATFDAGWTGSVQWQRNGTNISGATSATYVAAEADEGTTVRAVITSLGFIATGLDVEAPAATAPAAFTAGQWTATAGVESIELDITALPSDGGSAITSLQYRLDGGSAVTMSGTGTGIRTISGLSAVEYDVEIRAVNAVGNGAWSDLKARTPSAGAGIAYVGAGTPYGTVSALSAHVVSVPAGMAVGDRLIVMLGDFPAAASVVTSTGQNLTEHVRQVGAIWSVVLTGSVPTSVTVNLSIAADLAANTVAYRGVGNASIAGLVNEEAFAARPTIPYSTDAANAAVVMAYVRNHPESATAAQFNGADAADYLYKIEFTPVGFVTGIHDGPTGSNDIDMTWSATDTGGRHIAVAFKA